MDRLTITAAPASVAPVDKDEVDYQIPKPPPNHRPRFDQFKESDKEVCRLLEAGDTDLAAVKAVDFLSKAYTPALPWYRDHETVLLAEMANNIRTSTSTLGLGGWKEGMSVLHYLTMAGDTRAEVRYLANKRGANLECRWTIPKRMLNTRESIGASVLMTAAVCGDINVVGALLMLGADISVPDDKGWNALVYAAIFGRVDVMERLVDAGADLFEKDDENGITVLHRACLSGNVEAVKWLRDKGVEFSLGEDGASCMHYAAHASTGDPISTIQWLVSNGLDINLECTGEGGQSPIHDAIKGGLLETVKYLISHGASKEAIGFEGQTPFLAACHVGRSDIVNFLITTGVDTKVADEDGWNGIQLAISSNDTPTIRVLQQHAPPFFTSCILDFNQPGPNPIHFCAHNGFDHILKFLLECLPSDYTIDGCSDADGRTALHVAAENNQVDPALILVGRGASPLSQNSDGRTPLHVAADQSHHDVLRVLLESVVFREDTRKDKVDVSDALGWTALHLAACSDQVDDVRILLEHSASPFAKTNEGGTPLHFAACMGHNDTLRVLLESVVFRKDTRKDKADVSDELGWTALHHAAVNNERDAARILLDHGASPFSQAKRGRTPLHYAAMMGYHHVLRVFLESSVFRQDTRKDKADVSDQCGQSPLYYATFNAQVDATRVLLDHGASPFCQTNQGVTPLHVAARSGHNELLCVLLESTVFRQATRIDKADMSDKSGQSPLYYAASGGDLECVESLIQAGGDVFKDNWRLFDTPLHGAAWKGQSKTLDILLKHLSMSWDQIEDRERVMWRIHKGNDLPLGQQPPGGLEDLAKASGGATELVVSKWKQLVPK